MFRGYRLPSSATSVRVAIAALEGCGLEAREVATGGGSDANALSAAGFECVLLANGTEANHTPEERVATERIVQMLAVCEAIVSSEVLRFEPIGEVSLKGFPTPTELFVVRGA